MTKEEILEALSNAVINCKANESSAAAQKALDEGVDPVTAINEGLVKVGNAVGAIASSVSESVEFLVRPAVMGDETGRFEAFSRLGTFSYDSMSEALDDCERRGREAAAAMAERSGADDVVVTVERDDRRFEIGSAEVSALMEIRLRVTAAGRPRMFGVS